MRAVSWKMFYNLDPIHLCEHSFHNEVHGLFVIDNHDLQITTLLTCEHSITPPNDSKMTKTSSTFAYAKKPSLRNEVKTT
jgi:hypothetical protein